MINLSSKTYCLAKKKRVLLLAWVLLLCAFVAPIMITLDIQLGVQADFWSGAVILGWFLMWSAMAYTVYKWAMTATLVVSENQIDCDDVGSLAGASTTWDNIEQISVSKFRLTLILKESSKPNTKLGYWARDHHWTNPNVLELSSFIEHWQSGELQQDFQRYAPHLFDEEGKLK